jgi:hypothetical protein
MSKDEFIATNSGTIDLDAAKEKVIASGGGNRKPKGEPSVIASGGSSDSRDHDVEVIGTGDGN